MLVNSRIGDTSDEYYEIYHNHNKNPLNLIKNRKYMSILYSTVTIIFYSTAVRQISSLSLWAVKADVSLKIADFFKIILPNFCNPISAAALHKKVETQENHTFVRILVHVCTC